MLKKIILVRHGSTQLNGSETTDRIRGWQDVPLNDQGIKEANDAAKEVKKYPVTILVSSDLVRASRTAAIISHDDKIPFARAHITPFFRPWNLGQFHGMESKKVKAQIQKYVEQTPQQPVPGGESFHSFERRFFHGIRILCGLPGLPALVTHYRCICLLDAWAKAGYQPNGSIDHVQLNCAGEPPGHVKEFDVPVERIPR